MTEIESIADINLFADQLISSLQIIPENVQITIKVKPTIYIKMMSEIHSMINGWYGHSSGNYSEWFTVLFCGIKFKVVPDNG